MNNPELSPCAYCGGQQYPTMVGADWVEPLVESPEDGHPICMDCYHEYYEDTCCLCEDYFLKPEWSDEPEFFVIGIASLEDWKIDSRRLRPGIYEIVGHPFYASGIIEMHLYYENFRRIGNLFPHRIHDFDGYPMGVICPDCAERYRYYGKGESVSYIDALGDIYLTPNNFKNGRSRVFWRELQEQEYSHA